MHYNANVEVLNLDTNTNQMLFSQYTSECAKSRPPQKIGIVANLMDIVLAIVVQATKPSGPQSLSIASYKYGKY